MQVVVVTGMSGSGKSTVMDVMEDIGYYCIVLYCYYWINVSNCLSRFKRKYHWFYINILISNIYAYICNYKI